MDVVALVVQRKPETPGLRRAGAASPAAEKPRDVYLAVCERIASAFQLDGFRYLRSKHQFVREIGIYRHIVRFQGDPDNVAGHHVGIWLQVEVRCARLQQWRREQPHPLSGRGDLIVWGPVADIEGKHVILQWEFADPVDRNATIADATAFIRSIVLPWFKHFEDPTTLLADIEDRWPIKLLDFKDQLDVAYCFGGRDSAQRVLNRHIAAHPELHDSVRRALNLISDEGLDDFSWNRLRGEQVAYAHLAYGLSIDGVKRTEAD